MREMLLGSSRPAGPIDRNECDPAKQHGALNAPYNYYCSGAAVLPVPLTAMSAIRRKRTVQRMHPAIFCGRDVLLRVRSPS
jgi:hypothetical protein